MSDAGSAEDRDGSDDAAWLAALGGHAAADASPAASEAALLREAMLKYPPTVDAEPGGDRERIERLLDRARREGLLAERTPSAPGGEAPARGWPALIGRLRALEPRRTVAAVVVLAVLAVVIAVERPQGPPDEQVVRTAPDTVLLVRSATPEAARDSLGDALVADGLRVTRYTRFGRFGIDAELPRPLPPTVRQALDERRLPVPADGVLRVEYEPQ